MHWSLIADEADLQYCLNIDTVKLYLLPTSSLRIVNKVHLTALNKCLNRAIFDFVNRIS